MAVEVRHQHSRLSGLLLDSYLPASLPGGSWEFQSQQSSNAPITFCPVYEDYLARAQYRLENEKLNNTLPKGYPLQLKSALVWEGKDLKDEDWVVTLTKEEINEIEEATTHFQSLARSP
jgi:hypothetical protein